MRVAAMNWSRVEAYLRTDDRAVVPLGSTEQHAQLSLSVDSILSERLATEAAEPLNVPVFPVVPYGITPHFTAFPGTVSLRIATYLALIGDVLDSLARHGFRRILLVNGHGGNAPALSFAVEWMAAHPDITVRFHSWWNAPRVWAKVQAIDPAASHASWMENFPWTRLPGVDPPEGAKTMIDTDHARLLDPTRMRALVGDGNYGGRYQRSDEDVLAIWAAAVDETRALIIEGWR